MVPSGREISEDSIISGSLVPFWSRGLVHHLAIVPRFWLIEKLQPRNMIHWPSGFLFVSDRQVCGKKHSMCIW
jgi:hypothetical protein